jgi:hypothetical protein
VEPLLWLWLAGERKHVSLTRVQAGFTATTARVVLTDEHRRRVALTAGNGHTSVSSRRLVFEQDGGIVVALVIAVEVHLERTTDVRLIVRVVIEGDAVDLDGAVVSWWVMPAALGVVARCTVSNERRLSGSVRRSACHTGNRSDYQDDTRPCGEYRYQALSSAFGHGG